MKLHELLSPWISSALPDVDILSVHNDSRQVKPGALFFAYPGAAADGRLFMQQAGHSGASAIIYDSEELPMSVKFPAHVVCVPLPQLSKKLAAIASRFYDYPTRDLSVIGVTGTNGKTTIAYQLAEAYGLLGKPAAYIGTLGQGNVNTLQPLGNTTPDALCLQGLLNEFRQKGIQQVCMEVSSHALTQQRVDNIDFCQAIYTNLSHEHLDYHHTMEAYAAAKAALFATSSLKWAIVNHDDAYGHFMVEKRKSTCQVLTYGLHNGSDVRAVNWQTNMSGSELEIVSPWGAHHVHVGLLGKFNVYNSLAVFSSLVASDVRVSDVIEVMTKLKASPGRMEVVSQRPCVIVDYAHTPDALDNALSTLLQLKPRKLLVVFGCGGDRDKAKRPMMGRIANQYADVVIITSDNPRTEDPAQIIDEISKGLLPSTKALKMIDREEAIREALSMATADDIVLIAGKGHEAYQQIGRERFVFSDKDVVQKLLS